MKDDMELVVKYKQLAYSFVRARNPFELKHFVVGRHVDRIQQFKQILCEMDTKYKAIEEAEYQRKKKALEAEGLKLQLIQSPCGATDDLYNQGIHLELNRIEREDGYVQSSIIGALAELRDFALLLETEYSDLTGKTEDELLVYEKEYWISRLARQCQVDILSSGSVGVGNLDALLKLPKEEQRLVISQAQKAVYEFKEFSASIEREASLLYSSSQPVLDTQFKNTDYIPLKKRCDAPTGYPENRIVNIDVCEFMIGTLHRPGDNVSVSDRFVVPAGKNYVRYIDHCPHENLIGEYKSRMALSAISLGCKYLFIVDDDVLCGQDTLQRLYQHKIDVVGGWYAKKTPIPESASMIRDGETKEPVPASKVNAGLIEIDWSLSAGLTLYNVDVFRKMQYPYFHTSEKGTEDTYFTQKAIDMGVKSFLDTSVIAGHVDKNTGDVYYLDKIDRRQKGVV